MQRADVDLFSLALARWVKAIRGACGAEAEWPIRVGAGLYAAIQFLVDEPQIASTLLDPPGSSRFGEPYRSVVQTISELLTETVPIEPILGPGAPAAAIAGIGLVVGDRLRLGQGHRLTLCCPEMHLMILLPFLGFEEARQYVDEFKDVSLS
jgi:hypothetical protein